MTPCETVVSTFGLTKFPGENNSGFQPMWVLQVSHVSERQWTGPVCRGQNRRWRSVLLMGLDRWRSLLVRKLWHIYKVSLSVCLSVCFSISLSLSLSLCLFTYFLYLFALCISGRVLVVCAKKIYIDYLGVEEGLQAYLGTRYSKAFTCYVNRV